MRKTFQILGFITLVVSLYVAGYAIWRGPSVPQCDRPYYVDLPNGPAAVFFRPLIEIDREISAPATEVSIFDRR